MDRDGEMTGAETSTHPFPTLLAHAITAFGGEASEAQLCICLQAAYGFPIGEITTVVGYVLRAEPLFATSGREGEVFWTLVEQDLSETLVARGAPVEA